MKPLNVDLIDIKYRRPGLTKIDFLATYNGYYRRGTVVYNTVSKQFVTHTKSVDLLAAVCASLQQPNYKRAG